MEGSPFFDLCIVDYPSQTSRGNGTVISRLNLIHLRSLKLVALMKKTFSLPHLFLTGKSNKNKNFNRGDSVGQGKSASLQLQFCVFVLVFVRDWLYYSFLQAH